MHLYLHILHTYPDKALESESAPLVGIPKFLQSSSSQSLLFLQHSYMGKFNNKGRVQRLYNTVFRKTYPQGIQRNLPRYDSGAKPRNLLGVSVIVPGSYFYVIPTIFKLDVCMCTHLMKRLMFRRVLFGLIHHNHVPSRKTTGAIIIF